MNFGVGDVGGGGMGRGFLFPFPFPWLFPEFWGEKERKGKREGRLERKECRVEEERRGEEGEVGFGGDGVGEKGWGRGIVEEGGEKWGREEGGNGDEGVVIEEERGRRKDGAERRREGGVRGRVREVLLSPGILHVMSAAKEEIDAASCLL